MGTAWILIYSMLAVMAIVYAVATRPKTKIQLEKVQSKSQVWLHKVEQLEMLIIYDHRDGNLGMAQNQKQQWVISEESLIKNYDYIGEF